MPQAIEVEEVSIPITKKQEGIVNKIKKYRMHQISRISSMAANETSYLSTSLELLLDGGESTEINFKGYIGMEVLKERVTYQERYRTSERGIENQMEFIQEVIPENKSLPTYTSIVDSTFISM